MKKNRLSHFSNSLSKAAIFIFMIVLAIPNSSGAKEKKAPPLNILMITIDTLRADHLGCYGHRKIKTPQIDGLAKGGVLFEHAFTPTPTTLPAHASLFTGTYPLAHGIKNNGAFSLSPSALTLAEQLKGSGYKTAAFVSSIVLDSRFGLDQGFEIYNDDLITEVDLPEMRHKERRAEITTKAVIQWLDVQAKGKSSPFFLWVHYYDPHDGYIPPSPFSDVYTHCLYDGEIAYTDSCLGMLLNKMKEMGLQENTLIILAADHGEGLGEHQEDTHGIFLYDSTLHVPLIFYYPSRLQAKIRIPSLVRLVDIYPTILDLIGQKVPAQVQGTSLVSLLEGKKKDLGLTLYCETAYPQYTYGWSPLEGMRTEKWKYIKAPKSECYDLLKDPLEQKNLLTKEKKQAGVLEKDYSQLKKRLSSSSSASKAQPITLDASTKEKLRSLGYVLSTDSKSKKSQDPKDMIGVMAHFKKGAFYFAKKNFEGSVNEFKQVLKQDPSNLDVYTCLGTVYQAMGQPEKAIEAYRQAIAMGPEHLDNLLQLGSLLMQNKQEEEGKAAFEQVIQVNERCKEGYINLGLYYIGKEKWAEAKDYFEKALALEPKDAAIRNHCVSVYHKLGETEKAIEMCRSILKDNPGDPSALYNLGCIQLDQKLYPEAMASFQKLAKLQPESSKAYHYMGMIHFFQNSFDQALDSFKKATTLEPKWIDPHLNLGILYAQYKHDYTMALQEFQKVVEIDPQHSLGRQFLDQTKRTMEHQ